MSHRELHRAAIVLVAGAFGIASLAGCGHADQPANPPATTAAATTTTAPSTLSAPQTRQPHIMQFSATGSAKITAIRYTIDGQNTTLAATPLPWNQSLNIPADGAHHNYEVDLDYRDGSVVIDAVLDGQTVGSSNGSTSGGSGTAQLDGSFLG
ncbi:MAG TPA: hypothetical protein VGN81_01580 [Pseudonocardiaceae bacterium]